MAASTLAHLVAVRIDFRVSGCEALEEYFVRATGSAVLANPSLSVAIQDRFLGVGTVVVPLTVADLDVALSTFVLTTTQKEHLFAHERRVGAWTAYLEHQPVADEDLSRVLALGLGSSIATFAVAHAEHFALEGRRDFVRILELVPVGARLTWLACSKRGRFAGRAKDWLADLTDEDVESGPGRLALALLALARADLLDLLIATPIAYARTSAAVSPLLTRDQQLTLAGLPVSVGADGEASYHAWLATHGPIIEILLQNRTVRPDVFAAVAAYMERRPEVRDPDERGYGADLYRAARRQSRAGRAVVRDRARREARQHVVNLRDRVRADRDERLTCAADVQSARFEDCAGDCLTWGNCGKPRCPAGRAHALHEQDVNAFTEVLALPPARGVRWAQSSSRDEWLLEQLGVEPRHWDRFFALAGDWHASMGELLEVVGDLESR